MKDETLAIRLKKEDKDQIKKNADKIGMTVSQYVVFQLLYKDKLER